MFKLMPWQHKALSCSNIHNLWWYLGRNRWQLLGDGSVIPAFHVGRWVCVDLSTARNSCNPCRRIILALIQVSCGHPGIHLTCVQKSCVFMEMYFYVCLFPVSTVWCFSGLCCGPVVLQVTSGGSKVVTWRWGKLQEWNPEVLKYFTLICLGELSREGE